jgi:hypothetical protein
VRRTRKDRSSFAEEVRLLLTEEEDHRRREEDLRRCEQMLDKQESPAETVEEFARAVR